MVTKKKKVWYITKQIKSSLENKEYGKALSITEQMLRALTQGSNTRHLDKLFRDLGGETPN